MASLFDFGRSLTWPMEARTVKSAPKYLEIVFAFAGDSTINKFIKYFKLNLN